MVTCFYATLDRFKKITYSVLPKPPDKNLSSAIGNQTARYLGVSVYENGLEKDRSHGKHFSADQAYYYGQKWQCVEFVKRFYDQALNHRMPNVWGHARDFYDAALRPGALNAKRNLLQYQNNGSTAPQVNDILVFSDTQYGHLAVITEVAAKHVRVVQQNIIGMPFQDFEMQHENGLFRIHAPRIPDGWLRLPAS